MSDPFVGMTQEAVPLKDLGAIIQRCIDEKGWLFVRWPNKVSGMQPLDSYLDQLLQAVDDKGDCIAHCIEGQAFDQARELRWKRKGDLFELLLLSDSGTEDKFEALKRSPDYPILWHTEVFNAIPFANTETRLPNKINVPEGLDLEQRYFIDTDTASVQFIALRAK